MKEAFEKIRKKIDEITVDRNRYSLITGCNMGMCENDDCLKCLKKKILSIVSEVEAEYINKSTEHINKSVDCSTGWIDVKDRLPDIGERVLLWVYGHTNIGKRIDAKLFEYDIFVLERGTKESTKRIEAWRPLPEPYKPTND